MNWRDRAVCRAEDPDLFFPVHLDRSSMIATILFEEGKTP